MKFFRLSQAVFLPLTLLLALAGCQFMDTSPLPTGNQVLKVTVAWPAGVMLPDDATVTVTLLDLSRNNLPMDQRTLAHPGASPATLELFYRAKDIQPPHRARVEARVAWGGQLRLRSNSIISTSAGLVTPENAARTVALTVSPISGAGP
jgi:uncharacterized lipoprotein YbaY